MKSKQLICATKDGNNFPAVSCVTPSKVQPAGWGGQGTGAI